MKRCSLLSYLAAPAVALLSAAVAFGQGNSGHPLKVSAADQNAQLDSAGMAWRALGLKGAKDPDGSFPPTRRHVVPAVTAPGFYPADVSNPGNAPTLLAAQHHPIYINMPSSHWGDPAGFLNDLSKSNFIHVLDQYTGFFAFNRYPVGDSFKLTYPIPANNTLGAGDLLAIVHAAASFEGSGYHHIFDLFIPQGVDVCLAGSSGPVCYSPDNPSTFVFCGFHSAVTFSDAAGHVLFTVQPFQNVLGCAAPPTGTANGPLVDSTDDTLSHEAFETISDPDLNAWFVQDFTVDAGNEIGDLCARAQIIGQNAYSANGTVNLNGHPYTIQAEYSNFFHGCVYTPF